MMGKDEQISYRKKIALEDWEVAQEWLKNKRYSHALFFFLTIEKLLKTVWVKDNVADVPPFAHRLKHLYSNTTLTLESSMVDKMRALWDAKFSGCLPADVALINPARNKNHVSLEMRTFHADENKTTNPFIGEIERTRILIPLK